MIDGFNRVGFRKSAGGAAAELAKLSGARLQHVGDDTGAGQVVQRMVLFAAALRERQHLQSLVNLLHFRVHFRFHVQPTFKKSAKFFPQRWCRFVF